MDSSRRGRAALVSAAGWRLLFAACLGIAAVEAARALHYWAALVAVAALALTLLDFFRLWTPRVAVATGGDLRLARRLEEALALIDAVTVALFVVDPDNRVRFANRAARSLAGLEVGRLHDIPALDDAGTAAILALPNGGRQLVTLGDGRSMLVWVSGFAVPGEPPRRLVSMQAVAGELDAVQVGAWHMMTRVLAHEMMNSLTPVASLAESLSLLVATTGSDARVDRAVATIARRSRHLMNFVERYRTVVDLPEPKLVDIDLPAFMADIEQLTRPDLASRGIGLTLTVSAAGTGLTGDPALLEQAILNLVKNAAEAVAETGDARIEVTCTRSRELVTISVADNGPGIEEDRFEAIFVPFYTTKSGGAGIGLALARQVALAHGGRLTPRRGPGAGLILDLVLPG